jgi:5-methyltetrahydrofolate--homocysteine methyltransferase
VTLEKSRSKSLKVDWATHAPATKPQFLGTRAFTDVSLRDLIPYIDWTPFFAVWQLRGKYPNRGFPRIFDDENVGKEAKKVFDEAQAMIEDIIKNNTLQVRLYRYVWVCFFLFCLV